jgi:hypothetical protein
MRGGCCPRASLPPGAATDSLMERNPLAEALRSFGVTGPISGRLRAPDSGVAPQWSALVASCRCLELPPAVSGCLVLAATLFHRPGDVGASRSCPGSDKREATSTQA